jgi:hypothetical protein
MLELVGQPVPPGLDGRSLVPLLDGRAMPPAPVFAATRGLGQAALIAAESKTVLQQRAGGEWIGAFDIARDAHEQVPRPAASADAERLRAWRLQALRVQLPFTVRDNFMAYALRGDFVRRRQDPRAREDEQRLRSLGYVP